MKKILSFLFLLFLIITITIVYNKPKIAINDYNYENIVDKVFYESNDIDNLVKKPLDYNEFYLLFDEYKLTSNNFVSIFSFFNNANEITVKTIYPYINPLYQNNLNHYISSFSFINNNISSGINTMYERYFNILQDYGYHEEIAKIDIDGIRIKMVLISTSNRKLYEFLNTYPNIKYSLNINGNYKKIR